MTGSVGGLAVPSGFLISEFGWGRTAEGLARLGAFVGGGGTPVLANPIPTGGGVIDDGTWALFVSGVSVLGGSEGRVGILPGPFGGSGTLEVFLPSASGGGKIGGVIGVEVPVIVFSEFGRVGSGTGEVLVLGRGGGNTGVVFEFGKGET